MKKTLQKLPWLLIIIGGVLYLIELITNGFYMNPGNSKLANVGHIFFAGGIVSLFLMRFIAVIVNAIKKDK